MPPTLQYMLNIIAEMKGRASMEDPTHADMRTFAYLLSALSLGAMSAIANLLGDGTRILTPRVVIAYLLAGGLSAMGLVLLLIENYGFSYFLVGVAIFAGYKAFDVLTVISVLVTKLVKKLFEK